MDIYLTIPILILQKQYSIKKHIDTKSNYLHICPGYQVMLCEKRLEVQVGRCKRLKEFDLKEKNDGDYE